MTTTITYLRAVSRRLRRQDDGAALVEFAIIMPLILLLFAVTIEASRLMWSYQATIAGVRDAARYLARSAQTDICTNGNSLADWSDTLTAIVRNTSSGNAIFPSSITINSVNATLTCVTGDYRLTNTPIATVTAVLQITYPFQSLFDLVGVTLPGATTSVTDSSRIFGA